jgi:hypothetical protein
VKRSLSQVARCRPHAESHLVAMETTCGALVFLFLGVWILWRLAPGARARLLPSSTV